MQKVTTGAFLMLSCTPQTSGSLLLNMHPVTARAKSGRVYLAMAQSTIQEKPMCLHITLVDALEPIIYVQFATDGQKTSGAMSMNGAMECVLAVAIKYM